MRLMRANMLTLVDFADATFRAGRTEIERPRAVGSTEIRCEWLQWVQDRGRDAHCWTPPARIRTSPIRASGSYLGCLTAKR
jgi:phage baseplate assembly protein gpV